MSDYTDEHYNEIRKQMQHWARNADLSHVADLIGVLAREAMRKTKESVLCVSIVLSRRRRKPLPVTVVMGRGKHAPKLQGLFDVHMQDTSDVYRNMEQPEHFDEQMDKLEKKLAAAYGLDDIEISYVRSAYKKMCASVYPFTLALTYEKMPPGRIATLGSCAAAMLLRGSQLAALHYGKEV